MKKFAAGFIVCWIIFVQNRTKTTEILETWTAKLQLRLDMLHHDHPELDDGS